MDKNEDKNHPDQIARGILHDLTLQKIIWDEGSVKMVAAALREYGEAECKRVLAKNDEWYHKLLTDVRREAQEADAEGFARGDSQGYRRGVEESEQVASVYGAELKTGMCFDDECKEGRRQMVLTIMKHIHQRGQEGGK